VIIARVMLFVSLIVIVPFNGLLSSSVNSIGIVIRSFGIPVTLLAFSVVFILFTVTV
jgi:hypothetical protein